MNKSIMEQYRLDAICFPYFVRILLYDSEDFIFSEYSFRYEDYIGVKNRDKMLRENIIRVLFLKEINLPVGNLESIIKIVIREGFNNWKQNGF